MIETAIEEAAEAGLENVSFATSDVEVTKFDRTFEYAFSRMGTMFFASPVAALRNVREALVPGGFLNMHPALWVPSGWLLFFWARTSS